MYIMSTLVIVLIFLAREVEAFSFSLAQARHILVLLECFLATNIIYFEFYTILWFFSA